MEPAEYHMRDRTLRLSRTQTRPLPLAELRQCGAARAYPRIGLWSVLQPAADHPALFRRRPALRRSDQGFSRLRPPYPRFRNRHLVAAHAQARRGSGAGGPSSGTASEPVARGGGDQHRAEHTDVFPRRGGCQCHRPVAELHRIPRPAQDIGCHRSGGWPLPLRHPVAGRRRDGLHRHPTPRRALSGLRRRGVRPPARSRSAPWAATASARRGSPSACASRPRQARSGAFRAATAD